MKRETEKYIRQASRVFFGLYLLLLVYLMFFAEEWGRTMLEGDYRYNLVPFREIRRYIAYRRQIGPWMVFWNLLGNVIGLLSFELTLFIEVSQLILRVGSCDVDDMLLNTLGGCIGYGVYRIVFWKKEKGIYEETI